LRESGAIEQDADMVIFLYRADYYEQAEPGEEEKTEIHIAKHRNGATANVPVRFIGQYTRFEEWEETGFGGFSPDVMSGGSDSVITVASRMNDEDDTDAPF
jgi:replicative DNA helicase